MDNIIYTDGACSGNGKKTSTGGFGVYIQKSIFSDDAIKINKKCEFKTVNVKGNSYEFPVTNIRMEGYAILTTMFLYAEKLVFNKDINKTNIESYLNNNRLMKLSSIKESYNSNELKTINNISTSIHIITDSQFWINVIDKWMKGWISKKILLTKKNPDLLLYIYYYHTLLSQNGVEVKFIFVNSHQKGKRTFHADGNDVADVLATTTKDNSDNLFTLQN